MIHSYSYTVIHVPSVHGENIGSIYTQPLSIIKENAMKDFIVV